MVDEYRNCENKPIAGPARDDEVQKQTHFRQEKWGFSGADIVTTDRASVIASRNKPFIYY
jgi:hypothetical protein